MTRSTDQEYIKRVNSTHSLLEKLSSAAKVVRTLIHRYRISKMQAYRYLRQARQAKKDLPVPEPKTVFTVKLSVSLVQRLRRLSTRTGESLSTIVSKALEAFLKKVEHG